MTPTNKEWEKSLQAFRKVAKNIVEEQERRESGVCYHEEDGEDSCFPGTIEDDIVEALSSQAQELNEKHEAEIRALRKSLYGPHDAKGAGYCDTGNDMDMVCRSECVELAIGRFDHTLSKLRSNDKE